MSYWGESLWGEYGWGGSFVATANPATFETTLPALSIDFQVTQSIVAQFDVTIPVLSVSFGASQGNKAGFDVVIPVVATGFTVKHGSIAAFNMVLPSLDVNFAGSIKNVAGFALSLPVLSTDFPITVGAKAGFAMTVPAIVLNWSAFNSPATSEYKAIVMNLALSAISEYPDYPYNSFFTLNGQVYGLNDNGIFPLTGSNDNGTVIPVSIKSGKFDSNQGSEQAPAVKKRPHEAYLLHTTDGQLTMTLTGDRGDGSYTYTVDEERVLFGRGFDGRIFQWEINNKNGSSVELEQVRVKFDPFALKER